MLETSEEPMNASELVFLNELLKDLGAGHLKNRVEKAKSQVWQMASRAEAPTLHAGGLAATIFFAMKGMLSLTNEKDAEVRKHLSIEDEEEERADIPVLTLEIVPPPATSPRRRLRPRAARLGSPTSSDTSSVIGASPGSSSGDGAGSSSLVVATNNELKAEEEPKVPEETSPGIVPGKAEVSFPFSEKDDKNMEKGEETNGQDAANAEVNGLKPDVEEFELPPIA